MDQDTPETPANDPATDSNVITELENLIKNHLSSIDKLTEEAKAQKEMLDNIFTNDETYQKHAEAAKEASKVKTLTRKEILKRPDANALDTKIKELKASLKEQQEAISDYLQEYARLSGSNEIKDEKGDVREIVYVARLVRRPSLKG